jgi:hypothetical protein
MPPKILVSDASHSRPITTSYSLDENVLDFKAIYTSIKQLPNLPGRGALITYPDPFSPVLFYKLRPCSKEFLDTYWTVFASVVDYFADFASPDSTMMQSLWFHLLDVMEGVAKGLPHEFWHGSSNACEHAQKFAERYSQTIAFLNKVIVARNIRNSDSILHTTLRVNEPLASYPGAFKAGLKPWQQFLCNGSPGFGVPKSDREYLDDDPFEKYPLGKEVEVVREQHVPFGGLGIVARHTERLREAAIDVASVSSPFQLSSPKARPLMVEPLGCRRRPQHGSRKNRRVRRSCAAHRKHVLVHLALRS